MRRLLFQALASAADGAFVIDEDQDIVYWNRAAEKILGHSPERMLGHCCATGLNGQDAHGDAICRCPCDVAAMALGGRQVPDFDMAVRTRAGGSRWINVSTFVFPPDGREPGSLVVHLFRDVTQSKQSEELLQEVLIAADRLRGGCLPQESPEPSTVDAGLALTGREREVLALLTQGASTGEIAQALSISTSTVRNHVQSILAKFKVHSRVEAVLYAVKNGLIALD